MNSSDRTIYILGSIIDESVRSVCNILEKRGIKTVIIECFLPLDIKGYEYNTGYKEKLHSCADIDIEIFPSGKTKLCIYGQEVKNNFILWDKIKLSNPGGPLGFKGKNGISWYRTNEWKGLYDLLKSLCNKKIYNPPHITENMTKPIQQKIASDAGFIVPHTRIVTRKHYVQEFYDLHRSLIMKSINNSDIVPDSESDSNYSVLTASVSEEHLQSADDQSFQLAPHYVQQYIDKSYELRIVYIDGVIFAFKIDSQAYEFTKNDWRYGSSMNIFSPVNISQEIEKKLISYAQSISLFSGSFDLIVDKKGDVWFLECNQDGVWIWLDKIVDGDISKSFASALEKKL